MPRRTYSKRKRRLRPDHGNPDWSWLLLELRARNSYRREVAR